ncbi:unnamed protein product [Pleuronectes platessa]|uniref:C2H2-type domain-containing protein n=1 Tax=Pleuronectes platessa TaxID=8262 RepID=A0A9N7YV97_PLEPL|nr:unnamed protein product [Pleuronectes platessa]
MDASTATVQGLRRFISERLTAAAAEILGACETTIAEYEGEIDRQRRLLDVIWKPEIKLHRTVAPQQEEQVSEEERSQSLHQEERSQSLDQKERSQSLDQKERSQSLDQEERSHSLDQEERSQSLDQEERSQSLDQEERSQSLDQKEKSQSLDQEERRQSLDQKERSQSLDQKERSQSLDQEERSQSLDQEERSQSLDQEERSQSLDQEERIHSLDQEERIHSLDQPPPVKEDQEERNQSLDQKERSQSLDQEERSNSLDQEEPESPEVIEDQEEICSSEEGEQLVLKLEEDEEDEEYLQLVSNKGPDQDKVLLNPTSEERPHREPELNEDQLLPLDSPAAQSQDLNQNTHENSRSSSDPMRCVLKRRAKSKRQNHNLTVSKISSIICNDDFECDTCGKVFKWKSRLIKHAKVHTDDQPFSCKTFLLKRGTASTRRRFHSLQDENQHDWF